MAEEILEKTCRNCRFWRQLPQGHQKNTEEDDPCGNCHRYPPVLHVPSVRLGYKSGEVCDATWFITTTTWAGQWCGEWRSAATGDDK